MRILFITRTHPHRDLGALEARLHDRLRELSELGHDVLVLTKWSGEAIDFGLPSRIEVRAPFKSFQAWEWPKSLPMVFSWRPDVLHVFDPGLSTLERTVSVEMVAMTMLETLRRSARGRSTYRGGLVSMDGSVEASEDSWKRAGAGAVENGWLRASSSQHSFQPWDQAYDRKLRVALAGRVGTDLGFKNVLEAVNALRSIDGCELTVFMNRSSLSTDQRRQLAHAERLEAFGAAVGSRLRLMDPSSIESGDLARTFQFDAAILTGLELEKARVWIERLPVPIVLSESLKALVGVQTFQKQVSELAPVTQALAQITDREELARVWSQIEQGALTGSRDVAANHVSRIYSQIARTASSS